MFDKNLMSENIKKDVPYVNFILGKNVPFLLFIIKQNMYHIISYFYRSIYVYPYAIISYLSVMDVELKVWCNPPTNPAETLYVCPEFL